MIVSELVNLRALNKNDSQQILKWINNPELKYLTGTVYPISEFEHEKWFENKLTEKVNKMFGIEEKTTNNLIGVIGFNNTDFINRNTEIFVYIGNDEYWGKGIGTDAVKSIIKFAFEDLNLHRVSLGVFSYNSRAIKAYEKVGFETEGIMKESVFKAGKYHDKVLMAIINR
ncbi:GNAT family N-acetyltransferase [Metabacillus litoralis]|uniref:GNAT family N-acetyltransferase n=1 Tax=Metabacillus litoralis TaxID=152268 RepID=UPI00203D3D06|nr:GNAT family protein [Metabacillus litoralis]MCM3163756.1 GNAT family N-acetyltransferase [Metabacillus litoralis]